MNLPGVLSDLQTVRRIQVRHPPLVLHDNPAVDFVGLERAEAVALSEEEDLDDMIDPDFRNPAEVVLVEVPPCNLENLADSLSIVAVADFVGFVKRDMRR